MAKNHFGSVDLKAVPPPGKHLPDPKSCLMRIALVGGSVLLFGILFPWAYLLAYANLYKPSLLEADGSAGIDFFAFAVPLILLWCVVFIRFWKKATIACLALWFLLGFLQFF